MKELEGQKQQQQQREGQNFSIKEKHTVAATNSTSNNISNEPQNTSRTIIMENIKPATRYSKPPRIIKIAKFLCELTGSAQQPRDPPSSTKSEHVLLLTIGVSFVIPPIVLVLYQYLCKRYPWIVFVFFYFSILLLFCMILFCCLIISPPITVKRYGGVLTC